MAAILVGCSSTPGPGADASADVPRADAVGPDVQDALGDVARADAVADAASDVGTDVAPVDVAADVTVDTPTDVAADVTVDTPTDAGPLYASFRSIAAGQFYACGLTDAGAAYCWGQGEVGQLGTGATGGAPAPVAVVGGLAFASIRAGSATTCALTAAGAAHCWGAATDGTIGNGTSGLSFAFGIPRPTAVSGGYVFASLSVGMDHVCGLTAAGDAYCWGHNVQGELGINSLAMSPVPALVMGGRLWSAISAGGDFTCALTRTGEAYCWGSNADGRLGSGASTARSPVPIAVAGGRTFRAIETGERFACAVTTAGATYCWGANNYGQLGIGGADSGRHDSPLPVTGVSDFVALDAGVSHICGRNAAGSAFCWGYGIFGQLGAGGRPPVSDAYAPAAVMGGYAFTSMAAGIGHTCGTTLGDTYCWGGNAQHQLGSAMGYNSTPTPVLRGGS